MYRSLDLQESGGVILDGAMKITDRNEIPAQLSFRARCARSRWWHGSLLLSDGDGFRK